MVNSSRQLGTHYKKRGPFEILISANLKAVMDERCQNNEDDSSLKETKDDFMLIESTDTTFFQS